MSNPFSKIISIPVDTATAVGKPVLSGGADLAKQLTALVGGAGAGAMPPSSVTAMPT